MKEEKVSATVTEDCKNKLVKLKAHLEMKTLQEVVKYVLEKNVSSMLTKAINNTLKGLSGTEEEK